MKLTRPQREALKRVWQRHMSHVSYLTMRRRHVHPELYGNAIMVETPTMWLGIEPDGYTHS
jgi:hypothetical protein